MKKYLEIFKITWDEYMAYRLNFVMWRVRVVLRLLIIYFLWQAVFWQRQELFGYTKEQMLTYVLLTPLITSLITGSRSVDIGGEINQGDLTNHLLRPLSYFRYWWTRDLADKLLNFLFSIGEIIILYILLKPPVFIQTNLSWWILFSFSIVLSTFLYFFLNLILGFMAFWTPDFWGPRFLVTMIQEFLAGGIFPLDILPKFLFGLARLTPFPYLSFFPLSLYLGRPNPLDIVIGFVISLFWVLTLYYLMNTIWQKGLRVYSAEGR